MPRQEQHVRDPHLPKPPQCSVYLDERAGAGRSSSAAAARRRQAKISRGLAALRDFLPKGHHDPFANGNWSSEQSERFETLSAQRGVAWGCSCSGHLGPGRGGTELCCGSCGLWE